MTGYRLDDSAPDSETGKEVHVGFKFMLPSQGTAFVLDEQVPKISFSSNTERFDEGIIELCCSFYYFQILVCHILL